MLGRLGSVSHVLMDYHSRRLLERGGKPGDESERLNVVNVAEQVLARQNTRRTSVGVEREANDLGR